LPDGWSTELAECHNHGLRRPAPRLRCRKADKGAQALHSYRYAGFAAGRVGVYGERVGEYGGQLPVALPALVVSPQRTLQPDRAGVGGRGLPGRGSEALCQEAMGLVLSSGAQSR